jgi:hypothetical protein
MTAPLCKAVATPPIQRKRAENESFHPIGANPIAAGAGFSDALRRIPHRQRRPVAAGLSTRMGTIPTRGSAAEPRVA